MLKTTEYIESLDRLFDPTSKAKIDTLILKEICRTNDYRKLIDLINILSKLFLTGKQYLSVRELINPDSLPVIHEEHKNRRKNGENISLLIDQLGITELVEIIKQLHNVSKRFKYSIYSLKIKQMINNLRKKLQEKKALEKIAKTQGNFQLFEEEQYKNTIIGIGIQLNCKTSLTKINDFLKNPSAFLDKKFSNQFSLYQYLSRQILPLLTQIVLSVPLINHIEREKQIERSLSFISYYYVGQYQMEVQISKNTLVQTRIFINRLQKQFLFSNRNTIIKILAKIFNEALLCPSNIRIQTLLLRILRRLYFLHQNINFQESGQLQGIINQIKYPLVLNLRNISLFCNNSQEQMKEPAMLCYKLIQDKSDLELVNILQNSDELRFIKSSKYFSSKAYAYADEIEKIYDPKQLSLHFVKFHQFIQARQIWYYNIIIEKPSSLVHWNIHLAAYDIKFGFFKMETLRELSCQEYEKSVECKEVVKMEKIHNIENNPLQGHLYLKTGIYRFVFDNSHSFMRGKHIYYAFLHLDSS